MSALSRCEWLKEEVTKLMPATAPAHLIDPTVNILDAAGALFKLNDEPAWHVLLTVYRLGIIDAVNLKARIPETL